MMTERKWKPIKTKSTKHGKGLLDYFFEDCGSNVVRESDMYTGEMTKKELRRLLWISIGINVLMVVMMVYVLLFMVVR